MMVRMPDSRIPKEVFFSQLALGKQLQCGPTRWSKDTHKVTIKQWEIDSTTLNSGSCVSILLILENYCVISQ